MVDRTTPRVASIAQRLPGLAPLAGPYRSAAAGRCPGSMSGYRLVAPLAVLVGMLSVHDAHASGPLPSGRASFAIVEDAVAPTTPDIKPAPGATQAFPSLSGARSAAPAVEPSRPHPPPAASTNAAVSPAVFPEIASAPRSVGAERDHAAPDVPRRFRRYLARPQPMR